MKFSTPDQDNDEWDDGSCVVQHRSAGWFNICFYANPNGQYTDSEKIGNSSNVDYIAWYHWKNSYISLKSIQLMIRSRTWYQDVTTLREKSLLDFFLRLMNSYHQGHYLLNVEGYINAIECLNVRHLYVIDVTILLCIKRIIKQETIKC